MHLAQYDVHGPAPFNNSIKLHVPQNYVDFLTMLVTISV
jgi:hypothetical protein